MIRRLTYFAMATALTAASPSFAQTAPAATEGQATIAGTAQFNAPPGWTVERGDGITRVTAPEGDVRFVLVEAGDAADVTAAVAAAQARVKPDPVRKLRLSAPQPARDGWDEQWEYDYETSPNEQLAVFAAPYRIGKHWMILLGTGSYATFNKRSGQINAFFASVRPAGFVPETFKGRTAHKLDPARIEALRSFVRDAMAKLGIPGVGLAFIQDGRIVDERGLGVRELGKPALVDANTRFMVASNTKGMTTLLLAELVDQGKLRWDEPVVEAYPGFHLADPDVTKAIQIRHLVCACTGMPRQDLEWVMRGDQHTPASRVFDMLGKMKPTSGFGEVYQYSNLLAASAGYVAAHVAYPKLEVGAGYDKAMQEMVWTPLGMTRTTFDNAVAIAGDHAAPHSDTLTGNPGVVAYNQNDSIYFARPAGGAWSTPHDMALYALNELNEGRLANGRQLVSAKNLLERRFRGVTYNEGVTYGMGLENNERYGVRVIHHGGAMTGYKTDWLVIPEANAGAVILTNSDNGRPLLEAFLRRFLEVLYDGKPEAASDVDGIAATKAKDDAEARSHWTIPADPAAVARLAAHYTNPDLGHIDVRNDGRPVFDFGSFSSHMITRKNADGTTSFVMADPGLVGWELIVKPGAKYDSLVMRDAQHEYVYTPVE